MYLTFKAKIITDKKTEAILNNFCFSATKLYNTVNWYLRNEWQYNKALCDYCDTIGYPHNGVKIPLNRTELQTRFKDNHWAKNLHSQSAQFIIGEVINAYKSWFAHRKNGSGNAKPPGFRRKFSLSPVTFVQSAPALNPKNEKTYVCALDSPQHQLEAALMSTRHKTYLRLSLGNKREDSIHEITVKITHRPLPPKGTLLSCFDTHSEFFVKARRKLKNVKITYDTVTGNYYAHLVFDVPTESRQLQLFPTNVVAIDLGLNNIITATIRRFAVGELILRWNNLYHQRA